MCTTEIKRLRVYAYESIAFVCLPFNFFLCSSTLSARTHDKVTVCCILLHRQLKNGTNESEQHCSKHVNLVAVPEEKQASKDCQVQSSGTSAFKDTGQNFKSTTTNDSQSEVNGINEKHLTGNNDYKIARNSIPRDNADDGNLSSQGQSESDGSSRSRRHVKRAQLQR